MIISGMNTTDMVSLLNHYYSIENTLRRRGLDVKEKNKEGKLIQSTENFYEYFKCGTLDSIPQSY